MSTLDALSSLTSTTPAGPITAEQRKKDEAIDQIEFMQLLVTQLKNQDPLNPMQNEEFAVQLAQFTQVEQLIGINDKLEKAGSAGSDFSSLASYLGTEVWLNSDVVSVKNGEGGMIAFDLEQSATNVQIEFVDSSGVVRETHDIGALESGVQRVNLSGLSLPTGDYQARVVAQSAAGTSSTPPVSVAGIVNGYVPGPTPTLLVGDREVAPSDIKRVQLPF